MDPTGFPAPTSFPTSMSAPGAILDRLEAEIDRPEVVSQSKPTGMVLWFYVPSREPVNRR